MVTMLTLSVYRFFIGLDILDVDLLRYGRHMYTTVCTHYTQHRAAHFTANPPNERGRGNTKKHSRYSVFQYRARIEVPPVGMPRVSRKSKVAAGYELSE